MNALRRDMLRFVGCTAVGALVLAFVMPETSPFDVPTFLLGTWTGAAVWHMRPM